VDYFNSSSNGSSSSSSSIAVVRPHRSTTYVDVAYCYRRSRPVGWSVSLSVTLVSPAKTAESIEMPFGLWTRVGPRNHVLDGIPDPPMGSGNFEGKGASHCKIWEHSAVSCAKTAEPIEVRFGL